MRPSRAELGCWAGVAAFSLAGLGLATYLAVVYLSGHAPACGPLSGCREVTTSEYARFLGVPVTVMGVGAYATLLLGSLTVLGLDTPPPAVRWGLMGLAAAAAAFTAYLTAVELFVLHAVCGYCVTSAVLIGLILILSAAAWWLGRRQPTGPLLD